MGRQFASGDTTDTILTLARLMATTDLTGLQAACLSAPALGGAGDALGAGVAGVAALDAILIGMTEGSAVAVSPATGASMGEVLTAEVLTVAALPTVRRASAATEDFIAAVGSTAVAWPMVAAASTAVEGSTVVVDTGNCKPIRISHVR